MNFRTGRPKFVTYKLLLGLDKPAKDDLLFLAQATGQTPNGAIRYAIRQMARAFQVSGAGLQPAPQETAQVKNG
jgi:hypothetical protein